MSPKIIIFSKALFFRQDGGAERSLKEIMLNRAENYLVLSHDQDTSLSRFLRKNLSRNTKFIYLRMIVFLIKCCLNYNAILREFKNKNAILYGHEGLLIAFLICRSAKVEIHFRHISELGLTKNYYLGAKRYLKHAYDAAQLPGRIIYASIIKYTAKHCYVVVNSDYTSNLISHWNLQNISIVKPSPNTIEMGIVRDNLAARSNIVCSADNAEKGRHIFCYLSKCFPDENFILVDKNQKKTYVENNLTIRPWCSPAEFYSNAKIVIVPSQIDETFGRICAECGVLGIPCIASASGGLLESNFHERGYFVQNYNNKEAWRIKLTSVLHEINY
jgi:hypothetical protein